MNKHIHKYLCLGKFIAALLRKTQMEPIGRLKADHGTFSGTDCDGKNKQMTQRMPGIVLLDHPSYAWLSALPGVKLERDCLEQVWGRD